MRWWSRLLTLWLLLATSCATEDATPEETSAWSVVNAAFGPEFFDKEARKGWFKGAASEQLVLPNLVDAERYQFLGLAELRWMGPDRRQGEVAFSIDGWPATMMIQMTRVDGRWQFVQVSPAAQQERLVDLLGASGFPIARGATHWSGGFAGRDAAGRPTASVMVVVHHAGTFVDGQGPYAHAAGPVPGALRSAMRTRAALAGRAHAVYRPQVAIALGRRQPVKTLVELADWATAAGAEGLQLVARTTEGKPAWVPLARKAKAPPGARPKLMHIVVNEQTKIEAGPYRRTIPHAAGRSNTKALAFALVEAAQEMPEVTGGLLRVPPKADVGSVTALLLAIQDAMPETPFAVEVAP